MTAQSLPIQPEALLEHRDFVRALARSLVRDEHAAQDVVQETWLEALRHPPRSAHALRGWLARVTRTRAYNVARGENRRVSRERLAARAEVDESEEKLRARVALQHRVVEAVLALHEPYKTVVLLHYYEGLSAERIAGRRGTPAGTVRAQLSRAHGLLRERLDAEFGGRREAWSIALIAFAGRARSATIGAKLALAGGIVLVAVAAPIGWRLWTADSSSVAAEPSSLASVPPGFEPDARDALEAEALSPDPHPSSRLSAAAATETQDASTPEEIGSLPIPGLLQLAKQTQLLLQQRLLVPDPNLEEVRAVLASTPDAGLARILPYGRLEGDIDGRFLGVRGAGAYFSFFTRSNSYDQQPDIHLDTGTFSTRMYGGTEGFILDLDVLELDKIPATAGRPPRRTTADESAAWDLMWTDAHTSSRAFDPKITERANEIKLSRDCPAAVGHTYLVRAILPGEHDLLAAFTALAGDQYGFTLAWRVLHVWPIPGRGVDHPIDEPFQGVPAPSVWLTRLGIPELMAVSHRIRDAGGKKLFPARPDLDAKFASFVARDGGGVARLLHRGKYDSVVEVREAGAFYSFARRSSSFDDEPDLHFEQGIFSPASQGCILDLGSVPVESLGGSPPANLSKERREAWDLMWQMKHASETSPPPHRSALLPADEEHIQRLRLPYGVRAVVGHSYLLRSISREQQHDVLVAFSPVDSDEHGQWIVWRILKSWPMDRDESGR